MRVYEPVQLIHGTLYRPFVTWGTNSAGCSSYAIIETPFHIGIRECRAVAVGLRDPLLHVVALGDLRQCSHELQSFVETMIEVLCLGAWQGHYERKVAVWHDANEHDYLDLRLSQTISNIQGIAGKVNLPLVSRLVGVVVGYVMVDTPFCSSPQRRTERGRDGERGVS